MGIIPPISGKIELGQFLEPGYFEQEEREKNENTALEDVWNEYPGMANYEVRAALAACGLTNEHITSKVFVLSGGEAAKVRLCKLMLKTLTGWCWTNLPTILTLTPKPILNAHLLILKQRAFSIARAGVLRRLGYKRLEH